VTRLAHLLLVLSAIAPILFVFAATIAFDAPRSAALITLGVALLVLGCRALLRAAAARVEVEPKLLAHVSPREREPLAFLVGYALPVVAAASAQDQAAPARGTWAGVLAFAFVMALVVWQLQLFYVNPLLAQVLLVSRKKAQPAGSLRVAVLSEYLWLCAD